MEIQCKLLLYLDKINFISKIKCECEKFLAEIEQQLPYKYPPLRYLLELDVMHLTDNSADLGLLLFNDPLKWQRLCNEILLACILSLRNEFSLYKLDPSQVSVNFKLKNVPSFLLRHELHYYSGLTCFNGLLITLKKPSNYVYHTVWSCPEECEDSVVVLQYIPKQPPKCYVCRSVLFENRGLRRCGEQVVTSFKLKNTLQLKDLVFVDDFFSKLKLGARYCVCIVVLKTKVTVWSVEEVLPLPTPITILTPVDIQDVFEKTKGVPWKFIYCLASSIGINVCPLNCFMQLKITLLLSLVSVKACILNGSQIIHVLVIGNDTGYVGQLMIEAAALAESAHCLSTSNTSVSTALISHSGGVCAMPLPLHSYKQKQLSQILLAIESGSIRTETTCAKLQCAVWVQGIDFKKIVMMNVASIFGTVTRGDFGEYADEIAEFHLQHAIEPTKRSWEEEKALRDIVAFIDIVAGLPVALDEQSETLLKNYFLAARRVKSSRVTLGSMSSLVSLCLMSARLCRRTITNSEDAVFAIWLHVSGVPEPRFVPEEHLQAPADIKKLKKTMQGFKKWLEKFISSTYNNYFIM